MSLDRNFGVLNVINRNISCKYTRKWIKRGLNFSARVYARKRKIPSHERISNISLLRRSWQTTARIQSGSHNGLVILYSFNIRFGRHGPSEKLRSFFLRWMFIRLSTCNRVPKVVRAKHRRSTKCDVHTRRVFIPRNIPRQVGSPSFATSHVFARNSTTSVVPRRVKLGRKILPVSANIARD